MSTKRKDTRIKFQPSPSAEPKLKAFAEKKQWSLPLATTNLIDTHPLIKRASK